MAVALRWLSKTPVTRSGTYMDLLSSIYAGVHGNVMTNSLASRTHITGTLKMGRTDIVWAVRNNVMRIEIAIGELTWSWLLEWHLSKAADRDKLNMQLWTFTKCNDVHSWSQLQSFNLLHSYGRIHMGFLLSLQYFMKRDNMGLYLVSEFCSKKLNKQQQWKTWETVNIVSCHHDGGGLLWG